MKPVMQTQFDANPGPNAGNCGAACLASLLELSLEEVPNFAAIEDWYGEAYPAMQAWLRERGFFLLEVAGEDAWFAAAGYHIVIGKSPRGDFNHAVIYYGNQLAHDPYPGGEGIAEIASREFLVPLELGICGARQS